MSEIKNIPKTIYLQVTDYPDMPIEELDDDFNDLEEMTWCVAIRQG